MTQFQFPNSDFNQSQIFPNINYNDSYPYYPNYFNTSQQNQSTFIINHEFLQTKVSLYKFHWKRITEIYNKTFNTKFTSFMLKEFYRTMQKVEGIRNHFSENEDEAILSFFSDINTNIEKPPDILKGRTLKELRNRFYYLKRKMGMKNKV